MSINPLDGMRESIQRLSDRGEFVLVVAISFSYIIISSIALLVLGVRQFDLTTARVWRGLALELVIICAVAAVLGIRGWRSARLGLRFSWGAAFAGIPLFVVYMILYWVLVGAAMSFMSSTRALEFRTQVTAPFWLVVAFLIVNSFFEEVAVAAYVVEALSAQGPALAITASTLIRFSYHLYQGPIASLSVLPLGVLFAAVYWRWRSVWPLMVAHTIVNLLSVSATMTRGS